MGPATKQLLQSALGLPEDERVELVEALLAECDRSLARPFDSAWLAEVQRRSAEIDAGTAVLSPWSEVQCRVREKLEPGYWSDRR
jgi:putative addiction module component (TIGR02574 family)